MYRLLVLRQLLLHVTKERRWWLTCSFPYLTMLIVLAGTGDDEEQSPSSIYPLF